jgi:quinol---cytochrome c reductase cytochrome c subunit, bacillus type
VPCVRRLRFCLFGGLLAALALATAAGGCGSQQPVPQPPPIDAGLPMRGTPGERVFAHSGCLACHRIDGVGNDGPGPGLTHVGSRLTKREMRRALVDPKAPMPSFRTLPHAQVDALLAYLSRLR